MDDIRLGELMAAPEVQRPEVLEPSSPWRPIETAPETGDLILCCDARTGEIRVATRKLFFHVSGKYEWFRSDEFCRGHTWSLCPTHWIPLPEPPNTNEERE